MVGNELVAGKNSEQRRLRNWLLSAGIVLYLVIVIGGILRTTGGDCPDWLTCGGSWLPQLERDSILGFLHRLDTFLLVPMIGAAAWFSWRNFRTSRWILWPVWVSAALVLFQVFVGAAYYLGEITQTAQAWLTALHFALSLVALGLLLIPLVVTAYLSRGYTLPSRFTFQSAFSRLTLWTLTSMFLALISGTLVSASGATFACPNWPLCGNGLFLAQVDGWINIGHRMMVFVTAILIAVQFVRAWRSQKTQTAVLVASTAGTVLFFSQAVMGSFMIAQDLPFYLVSLHEASAAAAWAAVVVQTVAVGIAGRSSEEDKLETQAFAGRKGLARDLLMLTKPIVVALLLVTTFAGMVIGAEAWPSAELLFWTLLGGAMAAGGSGAINQYIDRFDDRKMQRTERRPIPSGRLTAGEGLAFGVGLAIASFYLVLLYVNLLAALLVLAGIIYYVLIYSIFLKKATVQNIVIGGGAGAIPPLVGWAAATGSLNIPSLFLFAVVFMWTPPHFWALAYVRRKDYARAGVPMLPVVRGEHETRWQILIYTIELVVLTLLLPLFGLGGSIYFVSAAALGLWLLSAAWKVWRNGGNKLAWKMYRYSSMYLAFLFLALMFDALL